MNLKLANKVSVITGGTSGIGLKPQSCSAPKARSPSSAPNRRPKGAERVLGNDGIALQVDLRAPGQIDKAIAEIVETHGHIDVVFANARAGKAALQDSCHAGTNRRAIRSEFSDFFPLCDPALLRGEHALKASADLRHHQHPRHMHGGLRRISEVAIKAAKGGIWEDWLLRSRPPAEQFRDGNPGCHFGRRRGAGKDHTYRKGPG
ncbi:hypothetical protein [Bordetella sp. H567]|uniref:hypothetical protein n=1 Tax=Bordetella sp. H567 TaxID=1697043 RepID=UPI001F38A951|nr:hypothetical protein [Bordetella sp. H567]